jgi:hypothetical protein
MVNLFQLCAGRFKFGGTDRINKKVAVTRALRAVTNFVPQKTTKRRTALLLKYKIK